jgi:hypothetical protein
MEYVVYGINLILFPKMVSGGEGGRRGGRRERREKRERREEGEEGEGAYPELILKKENP